MPNQPNVIDAGFFSMAIQGKYEDWVKKQKKSIAVGQTAAVRRSVSGLKNSLRRQIRRAGMGDRLANAWRSENYPDRGSSMSAAGIVFSKSYKIHQQLEKGTPIKIRNKKWMAIPTQHAVSKDGRRKAKPKDYRGMLVFIKGKSHNKAMLVQPKKEGGYVVLFILVKKVKGIKALDVAGEAKRWRNKIPGNAVKEMNRAAKRLGVE